MNAVEIEAAVSELAAQPFNGAEFPFEFLAAFGNKETTIAKLRKGASNQSDVKGAILQRSNIHIAVSAPGEVSPTLNTLRESPKTKAAKAKFILATDGETLEAEDLISGEIITCEYAEWANHFGFFLTLAGITTVKEIKDNPIDVRATGRLNKLYVELLKINPDWSTSERRPALNHFLARLIFCFFAEDTDIFMGDGLFTQTIGQMTEASGQNTHIVLEHTFRAMNIKKELRGAAGVLAYADAFPYVNGGLFDGSAETPKFSKIARTYLLRAGELNWRQINPDIFGSMIQAVADDEERGSLGMHYTSVPNILKVLNPLYLDDLREQLDRAGDHKASLLRLRDRMSRIRVFDPACGSGNFLVIAYKQMRAIEAEINRRRGEIDRASEVHLTNFRGIEIRDFAAEVARLALIIAEFQCDVLHRGPKLALAEFLPLNAENWIVCGNALRLNWESVCPPHDTGVKVQGDDLFGTPLNQTEIDFENTGGETYICGNPPYLGSSLQTAPMKSEVRDVLGGRCSTVGVLDYVSGWFVKAADYGKQTTSKFAFVTTNSVCQGQSVAALWPVIYQTGADIEFAHTSFKWANLAHANAGVTVAIVGVGFDPKVERRLFELDNVGVTQERRGGLLSPYLTFGERIIVEKQSSPLATTMEMAKGNQPTDGKNLLLTRSDLHSLGLSLCEEKLLIRKFVGSEELIQGQSRYCLWITDDKVPIAMNNPVISNRLKSVQKMRQDSPKVPTQKLAAFPHRFGEIRQTGTEVSIIIPRHSSENREFLPVGYEPQISIVGDSAFALFDAPLWNMALIASRLHLVWIGTVCGKLETRYRYSNTLGWNTFPVPQLTEKNKADLTRCAEEILLAREHHWPATIADLYDPETMPDDLRRAHDRNDETLERIFIGRRFKNDTERLEKLFAMYSKMVEEQKANPKPPVARQSKVKKDATSETEPLDFEMEVGE